MKVVFGFLYDIVDSEYGRVLLLVKYMLNLTYAHFSLGVLEKLGIKFPNLPLFDGNFDPSFDLDLTMPNIPNITEMFDLPGKFIDVSIDYSCCCRYSFSQRTLINSAHILYLHRTPCQSYHCQTTLNSVAQM